MDMIAALVVPLGLVVAHLGMANLLYHIFDDLIERGRAQLLASGINPDAANIIADDHRANLILLCLFWPIGCVCLGLVYLMVIDETPDC